MSIFFVLSGFLITYLLLEEERKYGRINIASFYVRRILRIWPLYYVVIIFAVTIFPILKSNLGEPANLGMTPIYYYTFLSNFDVIGIVEKLGAVQQMMSVVTWSVSVEEQFYLVWPLLFTITPKKFYCYIFLSIIIFSIFFRFYNYSNDIVLYHHSFSVCGDLAFGGLAGYYSFTSLKFKAFFRSLSTHSILITYVVGFMWLLWGGQHISASRFTALTRLISVIFFAFIILEQNFSENSFYKFSNSKLLTYWGKYTYGLYMLHEVALWLSTLLVAKAFSMPNPGPLIVSIKYLIGFLLTISLSYASYEYFEKRFLKLKDKFALVSRKTKQREEVAKIKA